jgi:hypothetical protein
MINSDAKIVPGHGTLFFAPKNTAVPANPLSAFTLTGTPPTGWENIGHTSKTNTAAFSRDGGEATKKDSWLADGIATVYDSVNWGLTINPIQIDKNTMDFAFNGQFDTDGGYIVPAAAGGLERALFLLATDGTGALGFYLPNSSVTLGDAPSITTDDFFELPLAASIQTVDDSVIASAGGKAAIMKIYKTGLTSGKPFVATATPTSVTAGGQVVISGSGFTGASNVKFGAVNASSFIVVSDTTIVAIMPAGSAGSAAITVTNAQGTSNAFPYTRGA